MAKQMGWIEVFRAGNYPQGDFSEAVIDEMVGSYDPNVHNAPMIPGHSSDWINDKGTVDSRIPALGWIAGLKRVGKVLMALPGKVTPELSEYLDKGLYQTKSIEAYDPADPNNPTPGKWHFKALAWLGAKPPAVKGLSLEYAELNPGGIAMAEVGIYDTVEAAAVENTLKTIEEFCAKFVGDVKAALESVDTDDHKDLCYQALYDFTSNIQEEVGEHFGFMDKLESMEEGTEMGEKSETIISKLKKFFKTSRKESTDMDAKEKQEFADKIAALETENKKLADQAAALEAQKAEFAETQKKESAKAKVTAFMESDKVRGKKQKLIDLGFPQFAEQFILSGQTVEFGEGDAKVTKTAEQFMTDYVAALPEVKEEEVAGQDVPRVEMSEKYGHKKYGASEKSMQIVAFAEEYVRQNPNYGEGTVEQRNALAVRDIIAGKIKVSQ